MTGHTPWSEIRHKATPEQLEKARAELRAMVDTKEVIVERVRAGIRIHPDEPTDVRVALETDALAALSELEARLEDAQQKALVAVRDYWAPQRDEWKARAEAAERELKRERETRHHNLAACNEELQVAERERDMWRERAEFYGGLSDERALLRGELQETEARVAELEEALRRFADGEHTDGFGAAFARAVLDREKEAE